MFRAGDLRMINDFSQGELCPPPPMCSVLPPSLPPQLVCRGVGEGRKECKEGVGGML